MNKEDLMNFKAKEGDIEHFEKNNGTDIDNLLQYKSEDEGIDFENYNLEEEIEKYKECHPQGYQVVIRIYKPKLQKKSIGGILIPREILSKQDQDDKFVNFVGLVVKMASAVYQDEERYRLTGRYCKVGDWVMIPRAHAHTYSHKGLTTMTISEDKILQVIDDPRMISRISAN